MRETVLSVVLGCTSERNGIAYKAIQMFFHSLTLARRRRLFVRWVGEIADWEKDHLGYNLPATLRQAYVTRAQAMHLPSNIWLALEYEPLKWVCRQSGVIVTTLPLDLDNCQGMLRISIDSVTDPAIAIAQSLRLLYYDPGLQQWLRRQRENAWHLVN